MDPRIRLRQPSLRALPRLQLPAVVMRTLDDTSIAEAKSPKTVDTIRRGARKELERFALRVNQNWWEIEEKSRVRAQCE